MRLIEQCQSISLLAGKLEAVQISGSYFYIFENFLR